MPALRSVFVSTFGIHFENEACDFPVTVLSSNTNPYISGDCYVFKFLLQVWTKNI